MSQVTTETASLLEKALSYVQRKEEQDQDSSLTAGLSIPSHEEVGILKYNKLSTEAKESSPKQILCQNIFVLVNQNIDRKQR